MRKMKVARIYEYGNADVFKIENETIPEINDNEILIENTAVGINFGELQQRQGTYPIPVQLPAILGSEVAGRIVKIGANVKNLNLYDKVTALLLNEDGNWQSNGYAEFAVVKAHHAVIIPNNLSEAEALGFLAQGLTAYLMLTKTAQSVENKIVAIHGASGGVGSMAVQIAKLSGAKTIIALTNTDENTDLLFQLGATNVINIEQLNWDETLLSLTNNWGADIILDAIGGAESKRSLKALAPFGKLITYGALSGIPLDINPMEMGMLIFKNQSVSGFANMAYLSNAETLQAALTQLFKWGAEKKLTTVTTNFAFDEISKAHQAMEERRTRGKVVLEVRTN